MNIFLFFVQNNIVKVLGKEKVEKVECIKTELVKVEGGRDKPVDIKGSNYIMEADFVVMATGSKPNKKNNKNNNRNNQNNNERIDNNNNNNCR